MDSERIGGMAAALCEGLKADADGVRPKTSCRCPRRRDYDSRNTKRPPAFFLPPKKVERRGASSTSTNMQEISATMSATEEQLQQLVREHGDALRASSDIDAALKRLGCNSVGQRLRAKNLLLNMPAPLKPSAAALFDDVSDDDEEDCVLEDEDGEPAIRVHESRRGQGKEEPGYFDYDPGLENWSGDEDDDDTEAGRLHRKAGRLLDEQEANMTEEDRAALRAAENQHELLGFADSVA